MATIQGIYLALFGRPADPAGLAYYNGVTNNGADLSGIGNLAGQKEYADRFAGLGSSQIVQSIYQSLFGRAGEQAGVDFWVGRLASGALTVNNIAIAILDGATGKDKVNVDAKIAAADIFTSHLDQPAEQTAYSALTVAQARDYIATIDGSHPGSVSDVDTLIAKMQVSAGQAPANAADVGGSGGSLPPVVGVSITVLDADHVSPGSVDPTTKTTPVHDEIRVSDPYHAVGTIDGGDGNDTVIVSNIGSVTPAASSLVNIEKLEIASSASDGGIDLKNVEGLQKIWRDSDTHNLTIAGIGKSVTTLGLEGNFTHLTHYIFSDTSGTDDAVTLVLKNATANHSEVWADGIEHITLAVDGDSAIALQANSLGSLTVTGKGDLDFHFYNETLNSITIPREIDASQHEGSTNFSLSEFDGSLKFTGGSGNDSVDVSGANQILTGGGGINTFGITSTGGTAGMNVITDFNPLVDYLVVQDLSDKVTYAATLPTLDRAHIAQSATFDDALAFVGSVTKNDKVVLGSTMVFVYDGDTYVYTDRDQNGVSMNDGVLKIIGVSTVIDPYHLIVASFAG